ncbi:AraC family ligand binding domain-containing protein [Herbiconiux sp.]|uniref:AraC family ligand binding domain-containing protein n=1 Tax=Herbiconiux sp. TaxID=1871186 RepID=UPI0025C62AD8|nr:AraC family ligand binding domain-containing protein [Herbiconiux sp.]
MTAARAGGPAAGVPGSGAWPREPGTEVRPGAASPAELREGFAIVAESETPAAPVEWSPHTHPAHELVWVRGGALTARVQDRVFTVSDGGGLWIPAGVVHAGRLPAGRAFHTAFFDPALTPIAFPAPTVLAMTAVLESVLLHLARADLDRAARARAEAVVFDVIEPSAR